MTDRLEKGLEIAHYDLDISKQLLRINNRHYDRAICFHAQQSAKKYLKAILVFEKCVVPKTHDLPILAEKISAYLVIPITLNSLLHLSVGAVESRYPSEEPELAKVKACIDTAELIQTSDLQYLTDKGVRPCV